MMILTDFWKEMKHPEFHPGELVMVQVPIHPFLLKTTKGDGHTSTRQAKTPTGNDLATRLSPSSLRPDSLRYDTIKGHTQTMFANTLTNSGIDRLFMMITLRNAGLEANQSRVSAPFKRFTTNSASENGSRLPKTEEAVRWRQRFNNGISNVGYSTSFAWYPLPRQLAKASDNTCGAPCNDTAAVSGPAASGILGKIVACNVVLALDQFSTATQTRRNVDLSHVRTMTQISEPRSSNSMLHFSWPFTQPNTRARMQGYIPFKMTD